MSFVCLWWQSGQYSQLFTQVFFVQKQAPEVTATHGNYSSSKLAQRKNNSSGFWSKRRLPHGDWRGRRSVGTYVLVAICKGNSRLVTCQATSLHCHSLIPATVLTPSEEDSGPLSLAVTSFASQKRRYPFSFCLHRINMAEPAVRDGESPATTSHSDKEVPRPPTSEKDAPSEDPELAEELAKVDKVLQSEVCGALLLFIGIALLVIGSWLLTICCCLQIGVSTLLTRLKQSISSARVRTWNTISFVKLHRQLQWNCSQKNTHWLLQRIRTSQAFFASALL